MSFSVMALSCFSLSVSVSLQCLSPLGRAFRAESDGTQTGCSSVASLGCSCSSVPTGRPTCLGHSASACMFSSENVPVLHLCYIKFFSLVTPANANVTLPCYFSAQGRRHRGAGRHHGHVFDVGLWRHWPLANHGNREEKISYSHMYTPQKLCTHRNTFISPSVYSKRFFSISILH